MGYNRSKQPLYGAFTDDFFSSMKALERRHSRNDTALEVKGSAYPFDKKQNYLSQQNVV